MTETWVDGHLDLAYLAVLGRDLARPVDDRSKACISLPDLQSAGVWCTCATIFTDPDEEGEPQGYPAGDASAASAAGHRQLRVYLDLERAGLLRIVRSKGDLARDDEKLAVVLLMEGADPIRDPEDVSVWFDAGLRMVGLTWSSGTRYAGGNARPGPLSREGIELVRALDQAGIIHDVSHLADQALDNLLALARGPVVATHSNARALLGTDDQRHLSNEHIRAIASRGGIIGLNLYSGFLARDRRATIDDAVAHVEHVSGVMGHRHGVALGSDMDGGFGPEQLPEGLDHPEKLTNLRDALAAAGWSDEEIRGFCGGNWLRFLRENLA